MTHAKRMEGLTALLYSIAWWIKVCEWQQRYAELEARTAPLLTTWTPDESWLTDVPAVKAKAAA